jgi:hypothetical protein
MGGKRGELKVGLGTLDPGVNDRDSRSLQPLLVSRVWAHTLQEKLHRLIASPSILVALGRMPIAQAATLVNHSLVWIVWKTENMLAWQRRIAEINE